MSHGNLLPGYSWDTQFDDAQSQFPTAPSQDEVISVYEVYVKEETVSVDVQSNLSIISSEPSSSSQLKQNECLDLDSPIGPEIINIDGTIAKLLDKDAVEYNKIHEQSINQEKVVVYTAPSHETGSNSRLIDKDDPRSRLHFVKYLKRDGSKEFRHQYTLMRHLPTHTDERNFKCEACGKAFRQLSTLSQHRAIHSDARPYVCEFCKKTFNRVSTLISHRKTHSEHKPHKCHLCGKGFHQKGNLRNHVFTHTNERPYKCDLCGKGFNQMSNLMCHKVKAHAHAEKMQYVCGICGKEFPRRSSLRSHEEYKHGMKYRNANGSTPLQEKNQTNPVFIGRNKSTNVAEVLDRQHAITSDSVDKENSNPAGYPGTLVVDKIETKAMENALLEGQTPFALFKPAKDIPVLVKVSQTANERQMLTPATAEDLRMAGDMLVSPTLTNVDNVKEVQVKVPVVATITQRIEPDGTYSYLIEPPGSGQEQENIIGAMESQSFPGLDRGSTDLRNEIDRPNLASSTEDCSDLLELAAQGGIQFVRATDDGRYEVMTSSEARDLMAKNEHELTVLDDEEAKAIAMTNLRPHIEDEKPLISGGLKLPRIDGMEILRDEDVRIIDEKNMETDRFISGITILDHNKIDDYMLAPKNLLLESMLDNHDSATSIHPMQNFRPFDEGVSTEFSRDDVESAICRSIGIKLVDDHYAQSMKLVQPQVKILGPKNHDPRIHPDTRNDDDRMLLSGIPSSVKILGEKNHQSDLDYSASRYGDYNIGYDNFELASTSHSKKEIKILGKKREFATELDDSAIRKRCEMNEFEVVSDLEKMSDDIHESLVVTESPRVENYGRKSIPDFFQATRLRSEFELYGNAAPLSIFANEESHRIGEERGEPMDYSMSEREFETIVRCDRYDCLPDLN